MLNTNKDKLVKMAVLGEVVHPTTTRNYFVDFDGNPRLNLGRSGIKYNISVGDPCYGWEAGDHVEPCVAISNNIPRHNVALSVLGCIGNEVKVISGKAYGKKGVVIGKHSNFIVWFNEEVKKRMNIGDKVQLKAWGVGLKIEGFEDIYINKLSPILLEKMRIKLENDKLLIPVAAELPAYIMGSGYGMWPATIDYDIQTTCPKVNDNLELKKLRFGDIVALKDQLNWWGRGYYKDAVSIGIVIHGWSYQAGHGPGVNTIISAKPKKIETQIDSSANIINYIDLR